MSRVPFSFQKDINQPTKAGLVTSLSSIVNFLKFREERLARFAEHSAVLDQLDNLRRDAERVRVVGILQRQYTHNRTHARSQGWDWTTPITYTDADLAITPADCAPIRKPSNSQRSARLCAPSAIARPPRCSNSRRRPTSCRRASTS